MGHMASSFTAASFYRFNNVNQNLISNLCRHSIFVLSQLLKRTQILIGFRLSPILSPIHALHDTTLLSQSAVLLQSV